METTYSNFSIAKAMEETAEDINNPLPRAVTRPNSFVLLDGDWRFSLDLEDKGLLEGWPLGHDYSDQTYWPSSVEAHMAAAKTQQIPTTRPENVIAWYERDFNLPPASERPAGSIIQLTFGACGYETQVWMNGFPLTTVEGEPIHYGVYTSFSYELHEEVLKTNNRITVRILDTLNADLTRGKQESHVYKRGGIWYQTNAGAVRSIWLETVERNRLRSRVSVVSIVEDKLVRFNLTTRIHDPGKFTIRLLISEKKGGKGNYIATADFPLKLEAGQKQQRVVIDVPNACLWSPESPHLYRLVAQLIDEEGKISQIETHFGLRKVEARGCCVFLNHKSIYLDGILYQPGTATYEEIRSHMYSMKALGCNMVRIHIAGVDPRIYTLADELGLLLWVEVPSPHNSNQRSRANHFAELVRMLDLIETHPSIIIWSLYNEDWGAQDIATNAETRQYIIDTYNYMLINHPQYLVVDNDGWQHISSEGRLKSDLLTAHLYTPDLNHWKNLLDKLTAGELDNVAAFPLVVGDPFFYRNQLPLIVSEWGGFGFVNYGGPADANDRAEKIKLFKEELRKRPIAGDVYTQATNIEDERNGLIDNATGRLMVPEGLLSSRKDESGKNSL
ncbi:MAG: sugar-binding domain-containing protein [Chitinophagaceae bacterium]